MIISIVPVALLVKRVNSVNYKTILVLSHAQPVLRVNSLMLMVRVLAVHVHWVNTIHQQVRLSVFLVKLEDISISLVNLNVSPVPLVLSLSVSRLYVLYVLEVDLPIPMKQLIVKNVNQAELTLCQDCLYVPFVLLVRFREVKVRLVVLNAVQVNTPLILNRVSVIHVMLVKSVLSLPTLLDLLCVWNVHLVPRLRPQNRPSVDPVNLASIKTNMDHRLVNPVLLVTIVHYLLVQPLVQLSAYHVIRANSRVQDRKSVIPVTLVDMRMISKCLNA